MIRFGCPTCNKVIKAPDEGAGRKTPCPRCGQLLVIPAPLHLKNKAVRGLLLPDSAESPAALVSAVESSVALQEYSSETLPPPIAEPASEIEPAAESSTGINEPKPVLVGLLVEAPLPVPTPSSPPPEPLSPAAPSEPPPVLRHSVMGITASVGAGVMFVVIFIFMIVCQSQADKISQTPGVNLAKAQARFDTLNMVAKVIGISSVITSLFWILLSFRSRTKRHWIIVGCIVNGLLLIWILYNPMAAQVTIPTTKPGDKHARSGPMLNSDDFTKNINPRNGNQAKGQHPEPKHDRQPEFGPANKQKAGQPDDAIVIKKARYLSDMNEFDVKVTQGPPGVDRFAKSGNLGYGEGDPRYANGRIRAKGEESPHGLSLCPDSNTFAGVKYRLDKTALTFIASVALNDTVGAPGRPPGDGRIPTPLTFQVWADGKKLLWQSEPVDKAGIVQECNVSVAGVDVLDLRIQCPGDCTNASAVWVEPRVLLK